VGLVAGACLIATAIGALVQGLWNSPEPLTGSPSAPPAVGLVDIRPPERIITLRERELLTVLNSEDTKPDDAIKASLELGLLYLKEHRLAEAADRFERLRAREREWRDPVAARTASLTGRLGLAVVLAHEKDKAEASNKLFLEIVTEPLPKFGGPKFERSIVTASWVLLRFPDLSNAVTDALNRNAVNLGKTKLEPQLEQLRSPQRIGAKD
jgi:serine/threonine-protein kinase